MKKIYKFSHPMVSCKKPNVSKHIWHEPTLMIVMLIMKSIIQCSLLNKLILFRTYQPQRKPNRKKIKEPRNQGPSNYHPNDFQTHVLGGTSMQLQCQQQQQKQWWQACALARQAWPGQAK